MPKSMSSGQQIWINIVALCVGVAIGAVIPFHRKGTQVSPEALANSPTVMSTTECASLSANDKTTELLGSPQFREPGTIVSSKDGLILVRWSDVRGAKAYNVRVWNAEGKEVKNFNAPKSFTFLKNLTVDPTQKETPYHVVVTPLGDAGERGKDSDRKMVAMLPLRNLEPPTIKSIQTEQEEQPK